MLVLANSGENHRRITGRTTDASRNLKQRWTRYPIIHPYLSDMKKTTRVTHHQIPIDDDWMLGGAVISAWVLYKPTTRRRGRVAERGVAENLKGAIIT